MMKTDNSQKIVLLYAGTFNAVALKYLTLFKNELASRLGCSVELGFRNRAMAVYWQRQGLQIDDLETLVNSCSPSWCKWVNFSLFSEWPSLFLSQASWQQNLVSAIGSWEDGKWLWRQCQCLFDCKREFRILAHGDAKENKMIDLFRQADLRLAEAIWLKVGKKYEDKTENIMPLLLCPGEHYERDVAGNEAICVENRHTLLEYATFRQALIEQLIQRFKEGTNVKN